jgi:hypothetical protein
MDFTLLANRRPGERFFGPTDKLDDTVNFLVWRQQADQLGVRLTNADVSQMIRDETHDELTDKDAEAIARMMRERFKAGFSEEALYAALGAEFRARIAQVALTGTATGSGRHTLSGVPTVQTPDESWDLFKDARTTVRVGMIDVPVQDFVGKVTATPPEDELKKLFDKHKTEEPAPDREEPGFKDPRKVQVAWVGAAPDMPYYQAAADRVLALAPALRLLGNTNPASKLLVPLQLDAELLAQEKAFRDREQPWTSPVPQVHESSTLRAENIASLVGATIASANTGAPAVPAGLMALQGRVLAQEAKDRATVGLGLIGLAAAPDPLGLFGAPVAAMPKVTLGQVRSQLTEKAKTELLTGGPAGRFSQGTEPIGLIASDLYAFRGEVMKLGREKGKDAVEKYVETFVKERGLQHGRTTEPRDQYHLGDDPGLGTLKQVYQKGHGGQDLLLRRFAPEFFADQSQAGVPDKEFIPHKFVTGWGDDRQFYWWRTEDVPARTPPYAKARPEVVAAWQKIQARELAKKEADRILEAVNKTPREAANLRDAAAQSGGREYFDLGPMALWMPQLNPTAMGGLSRTYNTVQPGMTPDQIAQVYHIPADKVAYPDPDMVKKLLDLREKAKGATTVVGDKPKQHYYVATLLERTEPAQDEFRRAYQGSMVRATEADPLLALLARGRPDEYRKAILEQLKTDGKLVMHDAARKREERSE